MITIWFGCFDCFHLSISSAALIANNIWSILMDRLIDKSVFTFKCILIKLNTKQINTYEWMTSMDALWRTHFIVQWFDIHNKSFLSFLLCAFCILSYSIFIKVHSFLHSCPKISKYTNFSRNERNEIFVPFAERKSIINNTVYWPGKTSKSRYSDVWSWPILSVYPYVEDCREL